MTQWRLLVSALLGIAVSPCVPGPSLAYEVDNFDQFSVADAAQGDPAAAALLSSELRLSPVIDVGSAFDAGTFATQIKALQPILLSLKKSATLTPTAPGLLTKDPKAYIASATIWVPQNSNPNSGAFTTLQGRLNIKVCWLNPDDADAANVRARLLTRASINATWEYHGKVSFVGWRKCEPSARGIKIQISDVRPNSELGRLSDAKSPSMFLNFTFNHPEMAGCQSKKDLCIHSIAVHEFGHALGFLHEQDSPDIPKWCKRQLPDGAISKPLESLKAKMATDWDEASVMDYCFDIYSRRIQLSDCDIAALHATYQKPQPINYQPKCPVRINP